MAIPGKMPGLGEFGRRLTTAISQTIHPTSPKVAGLLKYGGNISGAYLVRRGLFMPWELESVLGPDTVRTGLRRF